MQYEACFSCEHRLLLRGGTALTQDCSEKYADLNADLKARIVCVQPLYELLRSSFSRCSFFAYALPVLLRALQCLLQLFQLPLSSAQLILQIASYPLQSTQEHARKVLLTHNALSSYYTLHGQYDVKECACLTCKVSLRRSSSAMDCLAVARSLRSPGISSEAFAFACKRYGIDITSQNGFQCVSAIVHHLI